MAEAYDRQTTAGNDTDTLREILRSDHLHRRTALVGYIRSFDPLCQSATVQLGIQMNLNGTLVDVAPIPDVPVVFPVAGQRGLSYPVRAGDQCLVVFADRAIGRWLDRGGTVDPEDTRIKHLTDAICIPGLSSCANPIEDFNNNAVKITGGEDAFLTIDEDTIHAETLGTSADFTPDTVTVATENTQAELSPDTITLTTENTQSDFSPDTITLGAGAAQTEITQDSISLTTTGAEISVGTNCLTLAAGGDNLLDVLIAFAGAVTPPQPAIITRLQNMKSCT